MQFNLPEKILTKVIYDEYNWTAIENFGYARKELLVNASAISDRVSSHDTFFVLDSHAFAERFTTWVRPLSWIMVLSSSTE